MKKNSGPESRYRKELFVLMRKNQELTSIRNKGIDRKNVLSSGRAIPSSYGWQHLESLCSIQHNLWQLRLRELVEKEQSIREQIERHRARHKRDRSRISEDPKEYILKQRLLVLFKTEQAAKELFDGLAKQYKNATGYKWSPKPDINRPLGDINVIQETSPKRSRRIPPMGKG